ncbi:hypothetical protein PIB30_089796 [Stylosanthes scabra]|uniref:Uncharacterized protein n=1 Tax=Stylosanthes scabra TaxID=79078 RepID=A0ABU6USZ0_9FABA|nr:hypothetical protein [Stylosanthes scabra]
MAGTSHAQHADPSIHEPPSCFQSGPQSQSSQDTVDLAHDGVVPHPGTMTQWLVAGMMTSHPHAGGVPHVQLFCGMHDTPTIGSSHSFSRMHDTPPVESSYAFTGMQGTPLLHLHIHLRVPTHLISCMATLLDHMLLVHLIQSRLMWGSLLQSSTMQMSRGAGAERGDLHLVALVDVFSHPHLGVEDDIDFMYLASHVLIC